MEERIQALLTAWHEAGRSAFERQYKNLDYDKMYGKVIRDGHRWIKLDEGNSGAFLLDKTDGNIYRLKSKYGVPNLRKRVGHIDTVTGEMLNRLRWW